jgi:hypothetical protein
VIEIALHGRRPRPKFDDSPGRDPLHRFEVVMSSSAHARQAPLAETPFASPHVFVLAAVDGTDHQAVHRLVRAETTIGSEAEAHLIVEDVDVIARHCTIRCDAGQCHIIDTGSDIGTFVNTRRLIPGVAHRLRHLDEVQIGATRFLFLTGRFIDRGAKRS